MPLKLVETVPPEGCPAEAEFGRQDVGHGRNPAGFVVGGLVSSLFWGLLGVTAWLVI